MLKRSSVVCDPLNCKHTPYPETATNRAAYGPWKERRNQELFQALLSLTYSCFVRTKEVINSTPLTQFMYLLKSPRLHVSGSMTSVTPGSAVEKLKLGQRLRAQLQHICRGPIRKLLPWGPRTTLRWGYCASPQSPPCLQQRTKQQLFCKLVATEVDHFWSDYVPEMQAGS